MSINSRAYLPMLSLINRSKKGLSFKVLCALKILCCVVVWEMMKCTAGSETAPCELVHAMGLSLWSAECVQESSQKDPLASTPSPPIASVCYQQTIFSEIQQNGCILHNRKMFLGSLIHGGGESWMCHTSSLQNMCYGMQSLAKYMIIH